ncbi:chemotaxis protein CheW [Oceanobacillus kapialis]|uniref:chemotaxis protein CheW n=1 Tax=Oceanobacillus kapialis TaxID=481353 RepID=UPI00384FC55A
MDTNDYIEVFLDESNEHLQAVNDQLLKLEKQSDDLSIVNEIFRSAHTLKGMAATMGFEDIASLTHNMENVLDKIRNSSLQVTTEVIDVTFAAVEALEEMVGSIAAGNEGKKDVTDLIARLEAIENGEKPVEDTPTVEATVENLELDEYQLTVLDQAKEQGFEAYQMQVVLDEGCILKAARAYMVVEAVEQHGEIITTNPAVEELEAGEVDRFSLIVLTKSPATEVKQSVHNVSEVESAEISPYVVEKQPAPQAIEESAATIEETPSEQKSQETHKAHSSKTIRVNLERIDDLMNLFEEVVIDRSRLEDLAAEIKNEALQDTVEHMSRVSEDMQSLILTMRMVPVEQVFNRFPRMVRGLAKDLHKNLELEIVGADTELDRTVIDEIGDPLVHLIRNSIDHGIESPEERRKAGKPEKGSLILRAFHSGNHVFIEMEDDGAGINREKVAKKAIQNGILSETQLEKLTDQEVNELILASGFSTAETVSDISGRGVGLDVVKSKIESLGGKLSIESTQGKGSKFSIQLPLTLSILSTLLIDVSEEIYAIPLSSIIETLMIDESEIMDAHGQKVIDFRGNIIPVVSLKKVFNVADGAQKDSTIQAIVVVKKGNKLTGILVDSFIGQKEVVLKSMGAYLKDVFAISGATILGDGRVALILDPNALVK